LGMLELVEPILELLGSLFARATVAGEHVEQPDHQRLGLIPFAFERDRPKEGRARRPPPRAEEVAGPAAVGQVFGPGAPDFRSVAGPADGSRHRFVPTADR